MRKMLKGPGMVALAAMILLVPMPTAGAATKSWKNSKAKSCQEYKEGTAYQSRTGQRVTLTEVDNHQSGLVRLTVYFGSAWVREWTAQLSINGPRSYNKGKFTWRNDTCQDKTNARAQALNVGSLSGGMSVSKAGPLSKPAGALASYPAIAEQARLMGAPASSAKLIGKTSGVKVWELRKGERVYTAIKVGSYSAVALNMRPTKSPVASRIVLGTGKTKWSITVAKNAKGASRVKASAAGVAPSKIGGRVLLAKSKA